MLVGLTEFGFGNEGLEAWFYFVSQFGGEFLRPGDDFLRDMKNSG